MTTHGNIMRDCQESMGREFSFENFVLNGFPGIGIPAILTFLSVIGIITNIDNSEGLALVTAVIILTIVFVCTKGFICQEPNEVRVMMFFGEYRGTFKEVGDYWSNPFINTKRLSLCVHNPDIEPAKVNDKQDNPIMSGLMVVWKLKDTCKTISKINAKTMAGNAVGPNVGCIIQTF